ncbi:MAG: glycoside hydrolase family 99-like domain-containing protein [Armatimonadetes bacterium]|nr:glycoside hydrolase family 99-like domain-containing protein [Armatimonadota bacterium]
MCLLCLYGAMHDSYGGSPPSLNAAPASVSGRTVMAFYYTWYGTPGFNGSWLHWNEGGHHPDRRTPAGLPDIGSTHHPPVLYDSLDPALVRRHLREASGAGINVLIPTWWAPNDRHDRAFALLLREAEARLKNPAFPAVTLAAHYELVPENVPDPVSATVNGLLFLLNTYGDSPAYYRHEGKPVIFVYARAVSQLSRDQWREVLRRVRADRPALIVGDSTDPALYGVFDALFDYNPVGAVVAGDDMEQRYREAVQEARSHRRPAMVTVLPGYDDSHIGRAAPIIAPREDGRLYMRLWNAALDAQPDWVLITSFNEWHEGSEIEPSIEHGDRYLTLTRDFARMFHTGQPLVLRDAREIETPLPMLRGAVVITPVQGSRFALEETGNGGIVAHNRSAGPGRLRVNVRDDEEPYAFERGREDRLWRVLPPDSRRRREYVYTLATGTSAEIWQPETFIAARPDSPYRDMVDLRLHLELTSEAPGAEPRQWRVYPDGTFPIRIRLRNEGNQILDRGETELWAPEGWGIDRSEFFRQLKPGQAASTVLTVRPSPRAAIGRPAPAFVWVRFHPAAKTGEGAGNRNGQRLLFQSSVDLLPIRPVETQFRYGAREETTLHLKNLFPDRTLKGTASFRAAEGRTLKDREKSFTLKRDARLRFDQQLPDVEPPALRRTYATLMLGRYRQLTSAVDTATLALGATNEPQGVEWVDWEDGRMEPVTDTKGPARRAVPHRPGEPHYAYFNVTAGLPAVGDTYVQVEYQDEGTGVLRLQYDSMDPKATLEGRYKDAGEVRLTNTGAWKRQTWKLADARFAGRQNGSADFRLAFGPEPLLLRRVTVSKWPPPEIPNVPNG